MTTGTAAAPTAARSPAEVDRLVQDNVPLAYFLVIRFLQRRPEAEHLDRQQLESQALLALLRAARRFRPELGFQFSTYASSCITRGLCDILRRQRRRPIAEADLERSQDGATPISEAASRGPGPDQEAELADDCRQLHAALRKLPRPLRRAVVAVHMKEQAIGEASEALGISRWVLQARVERGLERLRQILM
jgi:RNA polymerase sigma factor (sigma-70 family)